jgi:hypothetical protein
MNPIIVIGAATAVGAWWWSSPTQWRAVRIFDPATRATTWRGPANLTRDQATNLYVETQNANWNREVSIFTHTGAYWRQGV